MKLTTLFVALVLFSVQAASAQTPQPVPNVIVVSGDAVIEAAPDQATVRLGVVRQSPTAQDAQEQANVAAKEILAAVTALGVPATRIQTSRLTLTPVYAPRRPESVDVPRIVAYNASNIVAVDLDNLAQVGPVIDAGLNAGANQLEGVQFRLKDDSMVREQALRQAVSEARRKAEVIAETLRVPLQNVLEVSEGGVSIMAKNEYAGGGIALARAQSDFTQTPVSPGQLEVRANVTVRFKIGG